MNFSVLLLKSEEEIQKEFFNEFLRLLRLHKAEFEKLRKKKQESKAS